MLDGDCTILVNGVRLQGWQSIEVHRSCEAIPNTFTISGADPNGLVGTTLPEGAPCQIILGDDPVLTGYVDTVSGERSSRSHGVTLIGRGKTSDLVDCTCVPQETDGVENLNFAGLDLSTIANRLCSPYGVDVSIRADLTPQVQQAGGTSQIPAFGALFTDTPAAVLTELARFYGLLMYEDVDGSLVFDRAAQTPAASGFVYGQNVERYRFSRSMAERFSEVRVITTATAQSLNSEFSNATLLATQNDPNVTRFRRHAQVCASPIAGFGQQEALWEVTRRLGRSRSVSLTATGWRDAAGALWSPNTTAPLSLPDAGAADPSDPYGSSWCISEVTLVRDSEGGTRTDVTLLPAGAFTVEPVQLVPQNAAVSSELAGQGGG